MSATITNSTSLAINLREQIEYPRSGVLSKVLVKDNHCQHTLFCLTTGTDIAEHTSTRNATVTVIEGKGNLTLAGREIFLEPGVFVFMPANAPHALQAQENLTFLLTLSENPQHSN
ncbi:MAG TPA: cupin domain-containing protein [Candidatus Obscuribacterales bacterium]